MNCVEKNEIVQIHPDHDEVFGGCLMVVTEPKVWGAQGYIAIPKSSEEGGATVAYYRCTKENFTRLGVTPEFILSDGCDENEEEA